MFYISLEEGENCSTELCKSPFTTLELGGKSVKIRKLQGSYFTVQIDNDDKRNFNSFAKLEIDGINLIIHNLDIDLLPDDELNLRDLLYKSTQISNPFPCLVFFKNLDIAICSCYSLKKITIGSSKRNSIVISNLSEKHCSIYIRQDSISISNESPGLIYVDSNPISGLVDTDFGSVITLSDEYRVVVVNSSELLTEVLTNESNLPPSKFTFSVEAYPCIVAASSLIRPSKLPLTPKSIVTVGREPGNDIWVPAPHVSRVHLKIQLGENSENIEIEDCSTNGTLINQRNLLKSGDKILIPNTYTVINLGKDYKLAICFSKEDEDKFLMIESRNGQKSESQIIEHKTNTNASKGKDLKKFVFWICVIILIMVLVGLVVWNFLL